MVWRSLSRRVKRRRAFWKQPKLVIGVSRGLAQMLGVAGERRDGDPARGGQVAEGFAGHQGAVEVHLVFVAANLTMFVLGQPLGAAPGGWADRARRSQEKYSRGKLSHSRGQGPAQTRRLTGKGGRPGSASLSRYKPTRKAESRSPGFFVGAKKHRKNYSEHTVICTIAQFLHIEFFLKKNTRYGI